MAITDTIFLFLFLPTTLLIYYIAKEELRKYILLFASLLFYACGSPDYFILLIVSLVVNIGITNIMVRISEAIQLKKILLTIGILYNVGILFYYKYFDFIGTNISRILNREYTVRGLALPLGLSFFTFKAISYLVDSYQGKIKKPDHILNAALYLSFFPQIQSGPLARYQHMEFGTKRKFADNMDNFVEGVYRFMIGFCKKILLANVLVNITDAAFGATEDTMTMGLAWLGAICYTMQLFFDFAGYSDMAIGLSKMFGYQCPENFNYPYITASVSEFWRRWHITLGAWFRDYIYIPLGGSRVKSKGRFFNLLMVWLATGIWHGASWNFIVWGLGYFVVIAFEKTTGWPEKFKHKWAKILYRIFSLAFINFQWVLFRAEGLKAGATYIKHMLCYQNNPVTNIRVLYLIKDNLAFLIVGLLLCVPVVPAIRKWTEKRNSTEIVYNVLQLLVCMGLFIYAVSFVISGQNNPFAYANF